MTRVQLERIASQMREFGFPSARVEQRSWPSGKCGVLGVEVGDFFCAEWELDNPDILARFMTGQFAAIVAGRDWRPKRPRKDGRGGMMEIESTEKYFLLKMLRGPYGPQNVNETSRLDEMFSAGLCERVSRPAPDNSESVYVYKLTDAGLVAALKGWE